jgi:hypothetical protein
MVAVVAEETLGAVNNPLPEMLPLLAVQLTAVFDVLMTVATNCCVPAEGTVAETGEMPTVMVPIGLIVTTEWAVLVASAMLVAVIVADVVELTLGAVNIPALVMVPGLALQTTLVFEVLLTVAAKCRLPPEDKLLELGLTATLIDTAGLTLTVDWACLVLSAALVAVTVAVVAELTVGAVNIPALEIVPALALQVTAVFGVLLTVATNCCLAPESKLEVSGVSTTATTGAGFTVIVAWAVLVGSATLVAVTVAVEALATLCAVNNPLLEMVPP